jgi:formiminotetrahydrofolate cyclodeaminase
VAVAAVFLESAFTCAYFNVEINLKSLGDKKLSRNVRQELKSKQNLVKRIRAKTEEKVGEIIRG